MLWNQGIILFSHSEKNPVNILVKILLFPFSILYGGVVIIRNKFFDWGLIPSHEFELPVICVGNISVGGTGKTPHVEFLIDQLKSEYRVAVLSRGYKRKTRGFVLADNNPDPRIIGDEPCQIKRKYPDILVAVDEKRVRGVNKLLKLDSPPEVVLLDDAFQHRHIKAGLNILLEDFNKPSKKDLLLPAGRLREPGSAKKRAHIILITKTPKRLKGIEMRILAKDMKMHEFQHLFFTSVKQAGLKSVFGSESFSESDLKNLQPEILLVTGIANPRQVKPFARKYSTRIKEMKFPDHYNYSGDDVKKIKKAINELGENAIILTTEKDSVKMQSLSSEFETLKDKMFYLPIRIEFLNEDEENFKNQIFSYVRDNKRDSILHKGKS